MHLRVDETLHVLKPLDQLAFAGESRTTCEVPDGATRDLNVMTRRGKVSATLEAIEVTGPVSIPSSWRLVVVVLSGRLEIGPVRLGPLDGLISRRVPLTVGGSGLVAVARLST
ncbi:MAG: uncharacterized protein QOI76_2943 [Frankiales bacterium]|jgi:environmental stress-induced protein Ves|nr:uncharacterized protein [Frankiales bacterium]